MPSLFDEIESASQAAITSVFGDGIRIRPMKGDGNYGGSPDPDRPVRDNVPATFSSAPNVGRVDFPSTKSDGAEATLGPSEIWIDRAAAAAIGYLPKRGDIIERLTGANPLPKYTISHVEPGDHGDLRIVLTK